MKRFNNELTEFCGLNINNIKKNSFRKKILYQKLGDILRNFIVDDFWIGSLKHGDIYYKKRRK